MTALKTYHLLLVTAVSVVVAACLVVSTFLALSRHYPHEGTRAAPGTATVSIVVTVLFGVVVNNLYSMKRDRDSRLRDRRPRSRSNSSSRRTHCEAKERKIVNQSPACGRCSPRWKTGLQYGYVFTISPWQLQDSLIVEGVEVFRANANIYLCPAWQRKFAKLTSHFLAADDLIYGRRIGAVRTQCQLFGACPMTSGTGKMN